jgi:hypothetical protein
METFLNGELVHANRSETVARYEKWIRHPCLFAMLELWFISTIQNLLRAIFFLAGLCEEELKASSTNS